MPKPKLKILNSKNNSFLSKVNPEKFKSHRFYPNWDRWNSEFTTGYINMVHDISRRLGVINNWVELGTAAGESAILTLGFPNIKKIHCVDKDPKSKTEVKKKLSTFIESGRCEFYNVDFKDFLKVFKRSKDFINFNNLADVVYLDGDQNYQFSKYFIKRYWERIRPGGVLAGHDYAAKWPGTIQVVDELVKEHNLNLFKYADSSWLVQKPLDPTAKPPEGGCGCSSGNT